MDEEDESESREVKSSHTLLGNEQVATAVKYGVPSAVIVSVVVLVIGAFGIDLVADALFAFTQWLYGMPINDFAMGMSESSLAMWVVNRFYAIPIMQMVHIMAIAGTFLAVMMMSMQAFGLIGHASLADVGRRYSKVLWWSLAVVAASGVAMLFGDTVRNLLNSIFWIKMGLLVVGILTAIVFARSLRLQGAAGETVRGGTKAGAVFLVVVWCLIMLCGRWIAYAPA